MKIRLVIDSEKGAKSGPYQGFELIPSDAVLDFVYGVAENYEKEAFRLYDEVERLIKEGEIDEVVKVAAQAKELNDYYLLIHRAAEQLDFEFNRKTTEEGVERCGS